MGKPGKASEVLEARSPKRLRLTRAAPSPNREVRLASALRQITSAEPAGPARLLEGATPAPMAPSPRYAPARLTLPTSRATSASSRPDPPVRAERAPLVLRAPRKPTPRVISAPPSVLMVGVSLVTARRKLALPPRPREPRPQRKPLASLEPTATPSTLPP